MFWHKGVGIFKYFPCAYLSIIQSIDESSTHPKFNRSPLKNGGWKTIRLPFGFRPIFRCYVSFREGKCDQPVVT